MLKLLPTALYLFSDESAKTPGDTQGGIPSDNPNRAILAKALTGHWVQIRLDDERPSSFEVGDALIH